MLLAPACLLALLAGGGGPVAAQETEIDRPTVGAFAFQHELTLPGSPAEIYDAITGDISGWWDHTFSGDPARFYIEPWPGGRFLELFEEGGRDGVLHATVTFARRGETLRFEGPLGLTGHAIHGVFTYGLEATTEAADSTRLTLSGRMTGEVREGWPEAVSGVWHDFLFDRLKPYVEGGGAEPGPRVEVDGRTLRVESWPPVTLTLDRDLAHVGGRAFDLYGVAEAETHVWAEVGPDSVVDRLYWIQVEEVLPAADHHYDYAHLPLAVERAGYRFVADARYGPGYSLDRVDPDGDTAEVLRLLDAAGYRMPDAMMRLRMVTLDEIERRELLIIYLEDLAGHGLTVEGLDDGRPAWDRVVDGLVDRAWEGLEIESRPR